MSIETHPTIFENANLPDQRREELLSSHLNTLLSDTFFLLALETDGENRPEIINELREYYGSTLIDFFGVRKEKHQSQFLVPEWERWQEIEAEGVGGLHTTIEYKQIGLSVARAELRFVKNGNGEYDFGLFSPVLKVNAGQGGPEYQIMFDKDRKIKSIEKTRYLSRKSGKTKDTRTLEFTDYGKYGCSFPRRMDA